MSDSVTPWTLVHQSPLPIGLSWQEYWSGVPFPTPYLMTGLYQRERRQTKVSPVSESTPVRFCDISFIFCFCKDNLMSILVAQLVKNLTDNSGNIRDAGLIPESRTFPGEGNGNPFQYSCLETSRTEEPGGPSPWGHKSQTRLSAHARVNVSLNLHHEALSSVPHSAMPIFIKKHTKCFLYF